MDALMVIVGASSILKQLIITKLILYWNYLLMQLID